MPLSPFTRILGALVVALFALMLLPWLPEISPRAPLFLQGILIVLVAVFAGSMVRQASPFNDRAFHLTLPDGRRNAFRRVLAVHAVVFCVISLGMIAWGIASNSHWPDIGHALLAFFLGLTAFCGAVGTVVTLGTAGRMRGISALGLGVLLVVGSWYLLRWVHSEQGLGWDWPNRNYYLSGTRCAWLIAALGYFFTWWWAAMERGKTASFLGVILIGALLPWVGTHANFFRAPETYYQPPAVALSATRKPLPESAKEWAKVTDMLELSGLEEGEFATIWNFGLAPDKWGSQACGFLEMPKGRSPEERNLRIWDSRHHGNTWLGKSGGQVVWGEQGVWKHLDRLLPPHETLEYFYASRTRSTREWPETDLICFTSSDRQNWRPGREVALSEDTWKMSLSGTVRWEIFGSCKVAEGARFRPPQGGVLSVLLPEEKRDEVIVRIAYRPPVFGGVPFWFGVYSGYVDVDGFRLMLVDETGKRAFMLGELKQEDERGHSPRGLVASTAVWSLSVRDPESVLRNGTLYLFHCLGSRYHATGLELPPP